MKTIAAMVHIVFSFSKSITHSKLDFTFTQTASVCVFHFYYLCMNVNGQHYISLFIYSIFAFVYFCVIRKAAPGLLSLSLMVVCCISSPYVAVHVGFVFKSNFLKKRLEEVAWKCSSLTPGTTH